MRNFKVDTSRIKLAQLRYYKVGKGAEISNNYVYTILAEFNGTYINPLNPFDELPVYDRAPYSNVTPDGKYEYGTKVFLVNGEEKDGLCYVLEKENVASSFKKSEVDIKDIENYVLNSKLFFIDRIELLEKDKRLLKDKYYKKLYLEDIKRMNQLKDFINSHNEVKEYEKK